MDFLNLLKEEWTYHLINILILFIFSIYGAYSSINKNIKLEYFRLFEKQNKNLTNEQKIAINKKEQKNFIKELIKAFFVLFIIYTLYIVYRSNFFA